MKTKRSINRYLAWITFCTFGCYVVVAQRGSVYQVDDVVYFVGDHGVNCSSAELQCKKYNGTLFNLTEDYLQFARTLTQRSISNFTCDSQTNTIEAEKSGKFYVMGSNATQCRTFNRTSNRTEWTDGSTIALFICQIPGTYGKTMIGSSRNSKWTFLNITMSRRFCSKPISCGQINFGSDNIEFHLLHNESNFVSFNLSTDKKCWWRDNYTIQWNEFLNNSDSTCLTGAECNDYICNCTEGFTANSINCTDKDECKISGYCRFFHNTTETPQCNNTIGSFNCSCPEGYNTTKDENNKVTCKDVNECIESPCVVESHGPHKDIYKNATEVNCTNHYGSYDCLCPKGFVWNKTVKYCQDIDECKTNASSCSSNCSCVNTLGSHNCVYLNRFTGNRTQCIDINECDNAQQCWNNSHCVNTEGNYTCHCNSGYQLNGNFCKDIDECDSSSQCGSNALCVNTNGSYNCICNAGYHLEGKICKGVLQSVCTTNKTACEDAIQQSIANATTSTTATETVSLLLGEITSDPQALTPGVINIAAQFIGNISKAASAGNINVTSSLANSTILTASNIFRSSSVLLRSQRTEVVRAISALLLQVNLDTPNETFTFATESISVKVQDIYVNSKDPVVFEPALSSNLNTFNPPVINIPATAIAKFTQTRGKRSTNSSQPTTVRSAFIYYDRSTLFDSENVSVISAELGDGSPVNNLTDPVKIQHPGEAANYGEKTATDNSFMAARTTLECVHWDFNRSAWSTNGCCLDHSTDPKECRCNHLTNFALLVNSKIVPSDVALDIVSDVGCILSILGLAFTIIVHCLHRELRRRRPAKILINICCNLLVVYLIFVTGVSRANAGHACTLVAVLLHYFMLTTWCWMAVYSYDMYMSVVKVFREDTGGFLQRVSAFSYGSPLVVVSLTLALTLGYADHRSKVATNLCNEDDANIFYSTYRAENMCWLTGHSLNFAFLLPVGILFLFNLGVFVTVLREISCKNIEAQTSSMKRTNKQMFIIASSMSAIMGMTWVFGYLMLISNDEIYFSIMSWLFAIFNTLQGVVIFFLTSVRSPELRKIWWVPIRSIVSQNTSSTSGSRGLGTNSQSYKETFQSTQS